MYCDETGKLCYESRSAAHGVRENVTRRRGAQKGPTKLNVYKCQFCANFHLGRPPMKGRKH